MLEQRTFLYRLVEEQLYLQVKISYDLHHDFLLRHGLRDCITVLDIGTGNGAFVSRLAADHPNIFFTGIDKRKSCIESSQRLEASNLSFQIVDMFSRLSALDFSRFDGFLMRYFFLHVDHAKKIVDLLKTRSRRPARFWIIDLDPGELSCRPLHPGFACLVSLVKEFCDKVSLDSQAGQGIGRMLTSDGFHNVVTERMPFTTRNIPLSDLALYLKQEILCYSYMLGKQKDDPAIGKIISFLDGEFLSGSFDLSYGMILVSAELG